jgi:signal transduction histidine kinase
MRARATALGRTLALGTIEPVVVRGNARLLREALLELLENGCRHGGAGTPVTTSVQRGAAGTVIEVSSATSADAPASTAGNGLGAQIVRWIAEGHGGTFDARAEGATFRARITLP